MLAVLKLKQCHLKILSIQQALLASSNQGHK
jgi:hypothetical protein